MAWTQTELVGGVPSPPPWPAVCSVQIIEHNSANTIALLKMFISCCIGEFNGNANGMKAHDQIGQCAALVFSLLSREFVRIISESLCTTPPHAHISPGIGSWF